MSKPTDEPIPFEEYVELILTELEVLNFHKVVNATQVPAKPLSKFMHLMSRAGYIANQPAEKTALDISISFAKVWLSIVNEQQDLKVH